MFVVGCFCSIFSFLWVTMICLLYIQVRTCSLLFYINDRKKQRQREKKRDAYNISAFWSTLFFLFTYAQRGGSKRRKSYQQEREREGGEKKIVS